MDRHEYTGNVLRNVLSQTHSPLLSTLGRIKLKEGFLWTDSLLALEERLQFLSCPRPMTFLAATLTMEREAIG